MNNYTIRKISDDSLLVISQASEPDLEAIDERLWEDYLEECTKQGLRPSYSDFIIWRGERE